MQRIVGGRFKGRKLRQLPRALEGVRPSSARVRGAIFDRLQGDASGARVLDLFAGSGALSLEALSRGASHVVAVEEKRAMVEHLKRQLRDLGVEREVDTHNREAIAFLGTYRGPAFDLVFLDPPYEAVELYGLALQGLLEHKLLNADAVIVCERGRRQAEVAHWPEGYRDDAERRHGDTVLHFLSLEPA